VIEITSHIKCWTLLICGSIYTAGGEQLPEAEGAACGDHVENQQLQQELQGHQHQWQQLEERIRNLERRLDESEAARVKQEKYATELAEQISNLETSSTKAFETYRREMSRASLVDNTPVLPTKGDKGQSVSCTYVLISVMWCYKQYYDYYYYTSKL